MKLECTGFRFSGVHAGIKPAKKLDLGLIVSDRPTACAAVFTQNRVRAAPVRWSQALLRKAGKARAIVVNSGNANACTGREGARDTRQMAVATADALGPKADHSQILVASTGVIGVPLPMEAVERGIARAASTLASGGFSRFARAILTTDRRAKIAARSIRVGGQDVTLLGCTKGAGMIAPDMATTLSFVVTDARVPLGVLRSALVDGVADTYNAITVDGDTSTNDMISVMANGAAKNRVMAKRDQMNFTDALGALLDELARKLMRDGEGVHHVVDVIVEGARSASHARKVARTIANSPLVKTAVAGRDPNWGRILCAAGNAGVPLVADRLELWIGDCQVVSRGVGVGGSSVEARAQRAMKAREYAIRLALHQGDASSHCLCCDLSHEYVSINADYRS